MTDFITVENRMQSVTLKMQNATGLLHVLVISGYMRFLFICPAKPSFQFLHNHIQLWSLAFNPSCFVHLLNMKTIVFALKFHISENKLILKYKGFFHQPFYQRSFHILHHFNFKGLFRYGNTMLLQLQLIDMEYRIMCTGCVISL